jgi:hypothetical protein
MRIHISRWIGRLLCREINRCGRPVSPRPAHGAPGGALRQSRHALACQANEGGRQRGRRATSQRRPQCSRGKLLAGPGEADRPAQACACGNSHQPVHSTALGGRRLQGPGSENDKPNNAPARPRRVVFLANSLHRGRLLPAWLRLVRADRKSAPRHHGAMQLRGS